MNYLFLSEDVNEDQFNRSLELLTNSRLLATDVETLGLDPHKDPIRLIQIAIPGMCYVYDMFKLPGSYVEKLLKAAPCIYSKDKLNLGFNLKFDLQHMWHLGIDMSVNRNLDLYLGARIANNYTYNTSKTKWNLDAICRRYLGKSVDKSLQKSDWGGELSQEQIQYAVNDVLILFSLSKKVIQDLTNKECLYVFEIECRALPGIASMEYYGLRTSKDLWEELVPKYENISKEQHQIILNSIPGIKKQRLWDGSIVSEYNLDSNAQLLSVLRSMGVQDPDPPDLDKGDDPYDLLLRSTSKDKLKRTDLDKFPIIDNILEYRKANKALSTYIKGIPEKINPRTGRIHCSFNQLITKTGRLSSSNPNLQNIPRDPDFRSRFIAADNYVIIGADYGQIEVRMMTELVDQYFPGEIDLWKEVYKNDADLYCVNAAIWNNMPYKMTKEWAKWFKSTYPDLRQNTKPFVLGYIYGLGAEKARRQAIVNYGLRGITISQSQEYRKQFFNSVPGLEKFHRHQYKMASDKGILRTKSGRFIKGSITYTEATNFADQGSCADIQKLAIALIYEDLLSKGYSPVHGYDNPIRLVLNVHDEIELEARKDLSEEAKVILSTNMVKAGESFISSVPVVVEAHVGTNLAEVK